VPAAEAKISYAPDAAFGESLGVFVDGSEKVRLRAASAGLRNKSSGRQLTLLWTTPAFSSKVVDEEFL